jgi:predicted DCC family thiol-disulfide oxidoreductase YuxK
MPRPSPPGRHVILYDGTCGLCDRSVRFVLPRDPRGTFRFAPLQSPWARRALGRHGESPDDLDTFWVVVDAGTARESVRARAAAVAFVLARLAFPWRVLAAVATLPRVLLDRVYDGVARRRYRWFGRHDRCLAPPPGAAERFVDGA